jgi:hypothetical protein
MGLPTRATEVQRKHYLLSQNQKLVQVLLFMSQAKTIMPQMVAQAQPGRTAPAILVQAVLEIQEPVALAHRAHLLQIQRALGERGTLVPQAQLVFHRQVHGGQKQVLVDSFNWILPHNEKTMPIRDRM